MIGDIVLNKTEIIKRWIRRVTEEYAHNPLSEIILKL